MKESRVRISKRLVVFNSASTVFSRLLNVTVLFWMYRYLLERIPPEEFAIYPVVAAIIAFAPLVSSMFTGGISRYIIDAYARGENEKVTEIHSSSVVSLVAVCLCGLMAGTFFSLNIEKIINVPESQHAVARTMMLLLMVNFFVQTAALPYTVGFEVLQKFAQREAIYVGREILRVVILLGLLLGISCNVLWIVVATVVANLAALTVTVVLSRRMIPELRFRSASVRRATSLMLMSFGVWTTLGQLSVMIYRSGGAIVLNAFGTPLDVTTFHLGATIDRQMMGFTSMATAPLQPALTAMNSVGDITRLGNTYLRGGRYGLWAVLFAACPLAIYSTEFVQLYVGGEFSDAAMVITLLLASYPFLYAEMILPKLAMARARVKHYFAGALVSSVSIVAAMVFATTGLQLGSAGIAGAILVGCIVSRLCYFWPLGFRLAEVTFSRFVSATLVPGLLPSVSALPVWLVIKFAYPPDSWLGLIGCTVAGQAVYAITLFMIGLEASERESIFRLYHSVQSRIGP